MRNKPNSARDRVRKLLNFTSFRSYIAKTFALFVAAGLLGVACAPEVVSFPTGQYLDEFGNTITLEVGDKFTVELPDGTLLVEDGQYTIDGDIIRFLENEVCPPVEGVYRWSAGENGHIQFELIEDDCGVRDFSAGLTPLP